MSCYLSVFKRKFTVYKSTQILAAHEDSAEIAAFEMLETKEQIILFSDEFGSLKDYRENKSLPIISIELLILFNKDAYPLILKITIPIFKDLFL